MAIHLNNRISHIVNIFKPREDSEFHYIQPITLASMILAKKEALTQNIQVDLVSAQFEKDKSVVPSEFRMTDSLTRSAKSLLGRDDIPPFPLIGDILSRLKDAQSDYYVFTNIDIALRPDFYIKINDFINSGLDAFIINRRRIPGHFRKVEELPLMFKEPGKPHPGFDCFVFHRDILQKIQTGDICIGIPFIGIVLAQNLFCYSGNFMLFENEYLTFHIGEEVFKKRNKALFKHNRAEFWKVISEIWNDLDSRKFPWGEGNFIQRLWKWGLHPSIPVRLCLKLEPRRWKINRG